MKLTDSLADTIAEQLSSLVKAKIREFNDDAFKPFHERLLGKKWTHAHAFIHSVMTTLGVSLFEQLAVTIARDNPAVVNVKRGFVLGSQISRHAQTVIEDIINELNTTPARNANRAHEYERIQAVATKAPFTDLRPLQVDLRIQFDTPATYFFEIKTARPNKSGFREYKRTLLTWAAVHTLAYPADEVHSLLAFPYDPFENRAYGAWTKQNLFDGKNELLVGKDFWNFIAGREVYEQLLAGFEIAGRELRPHLSDFLE